MNEDPFDTHWDTELTQATGHSPRSALPQDRAHFLVVCEGAQRGQRIEIGPAPIKLGRSSESDLQLKDKKVSSEHCTVTLSGEQILVNDLGSTNGTFIENARVETSMLLPVGSNLIVGNHMLRHEFRSRKEIEQSEALGEDLQKACRYVQSLLPQPEGHHAVSTDWCFIPSKLLGGDAFGYHWVDARHFAIYLIDVCGHGVGPAMHAVSVINAIRGQTLPDTDWSDPGSVLRGLNQAFQMDEHGDMYFSIWYGSYEVLERRLAYASAGHPPALQVDGARARINELQTRELGIGLMPDREYTAESVQVEIGDILYLFSDGLFEIDLPGGGMWNFEAFKQIAGGPMEAGLGESLRIQNAVYEIAGRETLEDDFSLLAVTFS